MGDHVRAGRVVEMGDMGEELFAEVASIDFLGFDFPGTNYTKMLGEQQAKTGKMCGVECFVSAFSRT
eukprot:COSAG04_NODE_3803_length_2515_cov_1.901490_1_plen_66_part_10